MEPSFGPGFLDASASPSDPGAVIVDFAGREIVRVATCELHDPGAALPVGRPVACGSVEEKRREDQVVAGPGSQLCRPGGIDPRDEVMNRLEIMLAWALFV